MTNDAYKIPKWFVGFVSTFICLAIPWCSWVSNKLLEQSNAVDIAKTKIAEINDKNWTMANQAEFTLRAAILNPGMEFPDPRDVNRTIVVDKGKITNAKINPNTITSLRAEYGLSGNNESYSSEN